MAFAKLRNMKNQLWPPPPTLTEANVPSQQGRVFIVTGGNSGIGFELCKILYGTGAKIYMASRSKDKSEEAIKVIEQTQPHTPGQLRFLELDLNDLDSVKQCATSFAQQESQLDVLWNNAGTGAFLIAPNARTAQGLEAMVGRHCVATLLFTELLLPLLRAATQTTSATKGATRVVWTSSIGADDAPHNAIEFDLLEKGTTDRVRNYQVSKAGTWILGREFARRHGGEGITSVIQNPGNVKANSYGGAPFLMMLFLNRLLQETRYGAYTELWAGLSTEIGERENGSYIIPWGRVQHDKDALRQDIIKAMTPAEDGGLGYGEKFWEWCEQQWNPLR